MKIIYVSAALLLIFSVAYADKPYWCIQIIRCSEIENAKAAYEKLGHYDDRRIEKSEGTYAVSVGNYGTKTKAVAALDDIRTQYNDAFLRKCGKPHYQVIVETRTGTEKKAAAPHKTPSKTVETKKVAASSTPESKQELSIGTKESMLGPDINRTSSPSAQTSKSIEKEKILPQKSMSSKEHKGEIKETPIQPNADHHSVAEKKTNIPSPLEKERVDSLKTGMQHYYNKKYLEAISALSRYISLSPKSDHRSAALFIIGKSFEEMGNFLSALNIFGRVLEEYPTTPEAFTSMIAMADIAINNPSLNYPVFMKGAEYVKDPVLAYDRALKFPMPDQLSEAIRFKKGRALLKQGHHKNSYDCLSALISDAPQTVYKNEILDMMETNAVALIDTYHKAGDHIATINLFFEAKDKNLIGYDNLDTILQSCLSLAHMGMYDLSISILKKLRSETKNSASLSSLDKTAAEVERIRLQNQASHYPAKEKWELYESGKEFLKADDLPMAQKKLSELKNKGGEPFWSKITDYTLEEKQWNKKYQEYLSKKK